MPTRSRSESDNDPGSEGDSAQVGVAGTVAGEGGGRTVAASGGFGLPLPGGLSAVMDPKRLLWLGGLAALATIEIIEWPVAVVIGVGSYVAERFARDDVREELRQRS
jgi:hypothetical protein